MGAPREQERRWKVFSFHRDMVAGRRSPPARVWAFGVEKPDRRARGVLDNFERVFLYTIFEVLKYSLRFKL